MFGGRESSYNNTYFGEEPVLLLCSLTNTGRSGASVPSQIKVDNAGLLKLNQRILKCCRWSVVSIRVLTATKPILKKFFGHQEFSGLNRIKKMSSLCHVLGFLTSTIASTTTVAWSS